MNKKNKKVKRIKKIKKFIKSNRKNILIVLILITLAVSLVCNIFQFNNKCVNETKTIYKVDENIVFFGDSITDLCQLDLYYGDLSLKAYNRGIGGDTTDGVLKRLKVSLYDINPSIVVLMIGTNDIIGQKDNDYILSNYEKIIQEININLPNTKLICMSIIPTNYDINEYSDVDVLNHNNKAISINSEISSLTSLYNFTYVDIYSLLIDENKVLKQDCSDDGLHLNHNGFIILYACIW